MTRDEVLSKYAECERADKKIISLDILPELDPHLIHYVDATEMGNISRFLNHSCDPSLVARPVFSGNYHDAYQPRAALFLIFVARSKRARSLLFGVTIKCEQ